jgi:hypothetical protein
MRHRVRWLLALLLPAPLGWTALCQHAAQLEIAAGATPKFDLQRMLRNRFVLLDDAAGAMSREALYQCATDGVVSGYVETISTRDASLAHSTYEAIKTQLRTRFGAPAEDSGSASLPRRIELWRIYAAAFSAHESVAWTGPREDVSVTLQRPRDGVVWQVITLDHAPVVATQTPVSTSKRIAAVMMSALGSAALVAALCLATPLRRFRALLAIATPLAIALELHCSSPLPDSPPAHPGGTWLGIDPTLAWCFAAGVLLSSAVAWIVQRVHPVPEPPPASRTLATATLSLVGVLATVAALTLCLDIVAEAALGA